MILPHSASLGLVPITAMDGIAMQLSASPELWNRGALLLGVSRPGRVRRSNVRIVAKLASGTRSEKEVVTTTTTTLPNPQRIMLNQLMQAKSISMSSGAMEELELERGVCNPFRKYTPDRVSAPNREKAMT